MRRTPGAFGVTFDWGIGGVRRLAPACDVVVIVDVLSFSTAVDIAVSRGARVVPCEDVESARRAAEELGIRLPARRGEGPSLSPASLTKLRRGDVVVLSSPNGAACSVEAARFPAVVATACLRNTRAVAQWAQSHGVVGVVAAGELTSSAALRRCAEDLVGAATILSRLERDDLSPGACGVVAAAADLDRDPEGALHRCMSARELQARGFDKDVALALQLDVSTTVPVMSEGSYRSLSEGADA
jgi:2-phosphosulfolactate phosphatase